MSQQTRNAAANARLVTAINALEAKAAAALAAAIAALPPAAPRTGYRRTATRHHARYLEPAQPWWRQSS